jgi:hypothetical protein
LPRRCGRSPRRRSLPVERPCLSAHARAAVSPCGRPASMSRTYDWRTCACRRGDARPLIDAVTWRRARFTLTR